MEEIWKPVVGYEEYYEVSNTGRVRTIPRIVYTNNGGYINIGRAIKTPMLHYKGYLQVRLKVNNRPKTFFVHRLVAESFIPNPNGYKYVNHIDEDKTNNSVENLEWCSALYNNLYGSRLSKISNKLRGRRAHNSIKVMYNGVEYPSLSDAAKANNTTIYKIKKIL